MSTADLLVADTWLLRSPSGFLSPPSGTCTHLYLRKQITHLSLLGIIVFFCWVSKHWPSTSPAADIHCGGVWGGYSFNGVCISCGYLEGFVLDKVCLSVTCSTTLSLQGSNLLALSQNTLFLGFESPNWACSDSWWCKRTKCPRPRDGYIYKGTIQDTRVHFGKLTNYIKYFEWHAPGVFGQLKWEWEPVRHLEPG